MVLLQEGEGVVQVPWLCCKREEALLRSQRCTAGGKRLSRGHMVVLQKGGGVDEIPWLNCRCCRREEAWQGSYGAAREEKSVAEVTRRLETVAELPTSWQHRNLQDPRESARGPPPPAGELWILLQGLGGLPQAAGGVQDGHASWGVTPGQTGWGARCGRVVSQGSLIPYTKLLS